MLIGPDNFTRPPASQRQRWDENIPLERSVERYSLRRCVAIWIAAALVAVAFWTPFIAAALSYWNGK